MMLKYESLTSLCLRLYRYYIPKTFNSSNLESDKMSIIHRNNLT
jgi:hypothetical protein